MSHAMIAVRTTVSRPVCLGRTDGAQPAIGTPLPLPPLSEAYISRHFERFDQTVDETGLGRGAGVLRG